MDTTTTVEINPNVPITTEGALIVANHASFEMPLSVWAKPDQPVIFDQGQSFLSNASVEVERRGAEQFLVIRPLDVNKLALAHAVLNIPGATRRALTLSILPPADFVAQVEVVNNGKATPLDLSTHFDQIGIISGDVTVEGKGAFSMPEPGLAVFTPVEGYVTGRGDDALATHTFWGVKDNALKVVTVRVVVVPESEAK